MANRQSRDPGALHQFAGRASIGSVPAFAVEQGDSSRALAELGGSLSKRLKHMADGAAAREGAAEGRSAGAAAGAKFVEKTAVDARGRKRGAGAPATPGKPLGDEISGQATPSGLSEAPLQLRNNGTIRGEAFDASAIRAYGWRMQTGLNTELAAAYDEHKDSPGGYEAAVAKIRETYLKDDVLQDGVLRESFDQVLAERTSVARLNIQSRHEQRLAAQQRAAAAEGVESLRQALERDAYNLGANPAGDELMAAQIKRAEQQIDSSVRAGSFSAADGAKAKKGIRGTILAARTQGTFDALGSPDAQADFALKVMDDYASGTGPFGELDLSEAQSLSDELFRRAQANRTRVTSSEKAAAGALEQQIVDDVASMATTGQGLDTPIDTAAVEQLLGMEQVQAWQDARRLASEGFGATAGMELLPAAELGAYLEALKPEPGAESFADRQRIYETAAGKARELLEERQTDPLGQAHRGRLVELKPIDASSPEALAASLAERRQAAQTVAGAYDTAPVIFREEERVALSRALLDTPELLPAFVATIDQSMGSLAPRALVEISEHGPVLALAGELALDTGSNGVAQDVAAVLAAKRDKTWTVKLPESAAFAAASRQVLGDALSEVPDLRQAVLSTANLLFERDVAAMGLDPSKISDPDDPAFAAYERSVDRALGARVIDGVKWGGLTQVNGRRVRAPSFMPAEGLQTLIETLQQADLEALGPIQPANGVPVRPFQIRAGQLVTLGDGVYGVALGDPAGFDPEFLVAPDGGLWELDVEAVRRSRAIRPAERVGGFGVVTLPGFDPFGRGQ